MGEGRGFHTQGSPLIAKDSGWGETYRRTEDQKGRATISSLPLKPWGDPSGVLGLCLLRPSPDLTALEVGRKVKARWDWCPREAVKGWEGFPSSEGLTHSKHTTGDGKHFQRVGGSEGSVASILLVSSGLARLLGSQE